VAWLEGHLELVTDGSETVSLAFLVPHAFARVDVMGLLVLELLTVGADILCGHAVVVFLLFLLSFAA